MSLKRITPSLTSFQINQNLHPNLSQEFFSDFSQTRKRHKINQNLFENFNFQQDYHSLDSQSSNNQLIEQNNLFEQQFNILRATSFKTISKSGLEKINQFPKNEAAEYDVNLSSSSTKKRNFIFNMSEQKISKTRTKGVMINSQKCILDFNSMKEISKYDKKSSNMQNSNEALQFFKKPQSSSSILSDTINTQILNDIIELSVNDQNEIDAKYLKKISETALIKNLEFHTNLRIQYFQRKERQNFFSQIKLHKLLDIDGFSINGLFCEKQRIRISLNSSIINKDLQQKFELLLKSNKSQQKLGNESKRSCEVQFKGDLYDQENKTWEKIIFYLSQIKDNFTDYKKSFGKNEKNKNLNFDTSLMINQESSKENIIKNLPM